MTYDEGLTQRVREALGLRDDLVEKKMFGGISFLVRGNMACGVLEDGLIVRVGPDRYGQAVIQPGTRPFDLTGRAMTGWVVVEPEGYASDVDLTAWVQEGLEFALTLPPK
ncbi:MAG: TfoX/Sxy family protein [Anaerolineae bacterium]|jgi:hypothetical protein